MFPSPSPPAPASTTIAFFPGSLATPCPPFPPNVPPFNHLRRPIEARRMHLDLDALAFSTAVVAVASSKAHQQQHRHQQRHHGERGARPRPGARAGGGQGAGRQGSRSRVRPNVPPHSVWGGGWKCSTTPRALPLAHTGAPAHDAHVALRAAPPLARHNQPAALLHHAPPHFRQSTTFHLPWRDRRGPEAVQVCLPHGAAPRRRPADPPALAPSVEPSPAPPPTP